MSDGEWELAIRFDDQSPSYAFGFEAGQFWAEMKNGASLIQRMAMEETMPMLRRMADYQRYILTEEPVEYGWVNVTLTKTSEDPLRRRLTVIKGGLGNNATKGTATKDGL